MSKEKSREAEVVATDAEVVSDSQAPQTTEVAVAQPTMVSELSGMDAGADAPMVLDWSWIHLAFETSKKKPSDGNQGDFFLGRDWEVKLCDKGGDPGKALKPNQYFDFVVVGREEGYKHYLTQDEFNAGVQAKRYPIDRTKKEPWAEARKAALAAGETIGDSAWHDEKQPDGTVKRVGPTASEYLQLRMLVKKPEMVEDDTLFSIPLGGEFYAPAVYEFDKGNWRKAYGLLQTVAMGERNRMKTDPSYKPTLIDKVFRLSSTSQLRNNKKVTVPNVVRAIEDGKPVSLGEAALADLRSLLDSSTQAAVSDEQF